MHCPSCGKPASADQQFCRVCGMNLDEVGKLVSRHNKSTDQIQKRFDRAEAERVIMRRMFDWIMWGMVVLGIGLGMLVVGKYAEIGKWFQVLTSFLLLGGMGMATAAVLNALRQGVITSGSQRREELTSEEVKTLSTNPFPAELPSVSERTTELIESKAESPKTGKLDSLP